MNTMGIQGSFAVQVNSFDAWFYSALNNGVCVTAV